MERRAGAAGGAPGLEEAGGRGLGLVPRRHPPGRSGGRLRQDRPGFWQWAPWPGLSLREPEGMGWTEVPARGKRVGDYSSPASGE